MKINFLLLKTTFISIIAILITSACAIPTKQKQQNHNLSNSLDTNKIIYVADIIRHGIRTPGEALPNIPEPKEWIQAGKEALLPQGAQQERISGKRFKRQQPQISSLAPNNIQLYSDSSQRTIDSMKAFVSMGFPKNTANQVINTSKIISYGDQSLKTLLTNGIHEIKSIASCDLSLYKNKSKIKTWFKAVNFPLDNNPIKLSRNFGILADNVSIYNALNLSIGNNLFSTNDIQSIDQLKNDCWSDIFNNPHTTNIIAQPLFSNYIVPNIKDAITQNKLTYNLFSSHDTTVSSSLQKLGATIDSQPNFAADLRIIVTTNNNPSKCGESTCIQVIYYDDVNSDNFTNTFIAPYSRIQ